MTGPDWFVDVVKNGVVPHDERQALVSAAREMRNSAWWRTIPVYSEPESVSGEFLAK